MNRNIVPVTNDGKLYSGACLCMSVSVHTAFRSIGRQ